MKKLFSKLLTLATVMALASFTASAQTPFPKDGSAISTGKVYQVKMFEDYEATLTPTISGTLIQDGAPELKLDSGMGSYLGYGSYGQTYSWQVEAGVTYKIANRGAIWSDSKVCFYMEAEQGVKILNCSPEQGNVISPNSNLTGEVLIHFNTSVEIDAAMLCIGNVEIELENTSFQTNTVALPIKSALASLYTNGTLDEKGGEKVTLKISGLRTASGILYNGDGLLTIDYISSPKLADLIATNVPSILKSYYPAGDPQGIWTFVFDQDILDDGETYLSITCGNPMSDGMFYNEILMPEINGATLTFDLCDKLRELDFYLALQDVRGVAVKLHNVRDLKGNLALGRGAGNVGSYDFPMDFNYIKPQALASEFIPASGTSLNGVDEIEIWFNNAAMIEFDGVEFTYHTDNGYETAVVLNSELSKVLDNNEMTINVKIPEAVKGHDRVTVSLYNMKSLDGYEYKIKAQYDMFVVGLLSPIRDGETIASTGTEDFVFNINFSDYYFYIRYDFYNGEGEEDGWAYGSQLTKNSNGTWSAYNGDFTCYTDFEPYMVVRAYYFEDDFVFGQKPVEEYKFTFHGTTEPFKYSDVKFVSIDPEPYTEIEPTDDFCFTVVYDGIVNINTELSGVMMGMGMGMLPFEAVPVYDGDEYEEGFANTWKLYPDMSFVQEQTGIDISIFAKDINESVVEGNMGAGAMDCMQFSYIVNSPSELMALTVEPATGETVETLSKFTVTCPGYDLSRNWNYEDTYPQLMNFDTWEVYTFTDKDIEIIYADEDAADAANAANSYCVITCPETIDTAGEYMLFIPANFFIVGEQYTTYYNEEFFGVYVVLGTDSLGSIVNEGSYEVYNMQGIRVMNTNDVNALKQLRGLYIVNGKKLYLK